MKSKEIRLYNITPTDLSECVKKAVDKAMQHFISKEGETNNSQDEILTVEETIEYLKCSKQALWNWRKCGILPSYRLGNRVYYKKKDILAKLVKQ